MPDSERQSLVALHAQIAALQAENQRLDESRRATAGMLLEMVSGLSHELSQPLSAIIAYTSAQRQMIRSGARSPEQFDQALERIAGQAERAAEFIRRLRGLIRRSLPQPRIESLEGVVRSAIARVEKSLSSEMTLHTLDLDGIPSVWIDAAQVEQALVQLLCNSIEALESVPGGGTIEIAVQAKGEVVEVAVRDTGPGLTQDEIDTVFMPFVTTKRDHLGLGLPMARSLIEAQDGRLWVEPSHSGALFKCALPTRRSWL